MIRLEEALGLLHRDGVEFIVVGGVAAIAHGSPRLTSDLDIAGRPKDLEAIAELEAILEERNRLEGE